MAKMIKSYSNVIVGKYDPKNGCHAADGTILFVIPNHHVPIKDVVGHTFTSANDIKRKSKFGWISNTKPFTISEFIDRLPSDVVVDRDLLESNLKMLEAASRLSEGAPVAVDYMRRGVEAQFMALSVHKVIFYN